MLPSAMTAQLFLDRLKSTFAERITGSNLEAIDPWIEVAPSGLVDVCRYLRDEPDLRFNLLCCVTGVDYCEPDPKKAAKAGFEPHLEVVYHLWSLPFKRSLVIKVMLPRWKEGMESNGIRAPRRRRCPVARSAHGQRRVEHRRLARARGLRPLRRVLHRPPEPAADSLPGRLGGLPAAKGLRDTAGVSRNTVPVGRRMSPGGRGRLSRNCHDVSRLEALEHGSTAKVRRHRGIPRGTGWHGAWPTVCDYADQSRLCRHGFVSIPRVLPRLA